MTDDADLQFMRRALRLAARARGRVSPNPTVGTVIVDGDGQIVGEGYHQQVGGPHSEANALRDAGGLARGSTVYCTLEPCAHHGRTPPCADALIEAGIRRLVCSLEDPDPRVAGQGFARLRDAGVEISVGLCADAAQQQNAGYLHHRRYGRPRVWLKLAQTLDGRIATRTGASKWITGDASRRHAHRWRSWMDMVAVGAGTVIADDPALTVRHVRGPDPRALVVSGRLSCPPEAQLFSRAGTVLATSARDAQQIARFSASGTDVWSFEALDGQIDLTELVQKAGEEMITSLLIEGGRSLASAALRAGIVDEVMIYVAPRLMGEGVASIGDLGVNVVDESVQLVDISTRRLGDDILYTGKVASCSPV